MRRVQLWVGLVVGVAFFLGACAVRAPKSNGMDQSAAIEGRSLGLDEVRGEVIEVDRESGTLRVLDGEEREVELRIGASTPIFVEGGISSLGQLVEGSPVRATYSQQGGEKVATWVEVPRPDPNEKPPRKPLEPVDEPSEPVEPPTLVPVE